MAFSRLEPERLHVVVLNRWMAETVGRNPLLGKFPVTVIPNGVDTSTFVPLGIDKARHSLGIPQEARVVLFVADYITNRRKGFSLLVQALNAATEADNLFLLSLGHGKPSLSSRIPHLHLGHSVDDRRLALAYSAADVYVIPSLQDNQPNTVLEAMACGTPVVGFNVGGIPDMVRSGITGLLAPAGDVDGLLGAIREILRCPARRATMGANCRRIVMEEYRLNEQVRSYAQVYETVLKEVAAKVVASKTCSILESS
jgi:glycosyltransferase involved in cell wall biosynthesis